MLNTAEIRTDLERRRRTLLGELSRVEDDLHGLDTNVEIEPQEEAQESVIANVLSGLDDRVRGELSAIDRALTRLSKGEYGRCSTCREPIPEKRLRAVPTAERCTECARALEP
jgi:RNA polymerase-binding transcription factor DksA